MVLVGVIGAFVFIGVVYWWTQTPSEWESSASRAEHTRRAYRASRGGGGPVTGAGAGHEGSSGSRWGYGDTPPWRAPAPWGDGPQAPGTRFGDGSRYRD
jgi:hypothetical protein